MSKLYPTAAEAVAASIAAGGATTHAAYSHDNWAHLFERHTGLIWHLSDGDTLFERHERGNTWSVALECRLNARTRILTDRLIGEIVTAYHNGNTSEDKP